MSSSLRRCPAWRKSGPCIRWLSVRRPCPLPGMPGPPTPTTPHPSRIPAAARAPSHPGLAPGVEPALPPLFPHVPPAVPPPSLPGRLSFSQRHAALPLSFSGYCLLLSIEIVCIGLSVHQDEAGVPLSGSYETQCGLPAALTAGGQRQLHFAALRLSSASPQTNWMKFWRQLSRPSVQARVLGPEALHPWANTGPKASLPRR